MPKSQLINSASEDENNGTNENETTDEYLSDFTKLQLQIYEPCVSKEFVTKILPRKESSGSEEDISKEKTLEILSGVLRVNINQWLLCRKQLVLG